MLRLKRPCARDAGEIYPFLRDTPYDENGFINEWHGLSEEDCVRAIEIYSANERGDMLPEGYVPETFFFLWDDGGIVGEFRVRHYLCPSLVEGAGHIGYYISPAYRGRGYATEGLRLALGEARRIVPEDEIYLRVLRSNPASLRVMLKNGGYIHHADDIHCYVRIKK